MVDFAQAIPFGDVSSKTIAMTLLAIFLAILISALIGVVVWYYIRKKQLKYSIPYLKDIGNKPMKVGVYKAMDIPVSRAGDKLWYIPKLKKFIMPGTLQTAPNEYTHYERKDGELINIDYPDIDEKMRKLNVRFVQQDMRSQRIAIANILEARFKEKKGFWEQWGHIITPIIYLLVVCVCMVIIFYQWSDVVDKMSSLFDRISSYEEKRRQDFLPTTASIILCYLKVRAYNGL